MKSEYDFPEDLYVNIRNVEGQGIKAEIYRRIESEEGELVHMKRAGLVWLRDVSALSLEGVAEILGRKEMWDAKS